MKVMKPCTSLSSSSPDSFRRPQPSRLSPSETEPEESGFLREEVGIGTSVPVPWIIGPQCTRPDRQTQSAAAADRLQWAMRARHPSHRQPESDTLHAREVAGD